jgi:hypothetical protein
MSKQERSPPGSIRTDDSPRFLSLRAGIKGLADALGVLAAIGAVAGFFGAAGWAFDIASHFNVTPWSHPFRRLLRQFGLEDSQRGFGIQATWPATRFAMRIPVDHVLHSADIRVTGRSVGPDVGSDHYPAIVDFLMAPAPAQDEPPVLPQPAAPARGQP